jgi:hypothetical protein
MVRIAQGRLANGGATARDGLTIRYEAGASLKPITARPQSFIAQSLE